MMIFFSLECLNFQYAKQLKKLEEDLKEVEAAESLSTKLKYVSYMINECFFFVEESLT